MPAHTYEVLDKQHPFKDDCIALFDDGLWTLIKFEHNHWIVWIDIDLTKYWVNIPLSINESWKTLHESKNFPPQPVEKESVATVTVTVDKIESMENLHCSFCWDGTRCVEEFCHCHSEENNDVRKDSSEDS